MTKSAETPTPYKSSIEPVRPSSLDILGHQFSSALKGARNFFRKPGAKEGTAAAGAILVGASALEPAAAQIATQSADTYKPQIDPTGRTITVNQESTESENPVEANDPEPHLGPRPKPSTKPGGPPRSKPQGGPNNEGPYPPETSEQVDVGPKGSTGEFTAPAIAAGPEQAPRIDGIYMNRPVDNSKPPYTETELEKPREYFQATLDEMAKHPVLKKYSDTLMTRESQHNWMNFVKFGRPIIHAVYHYSAADYSETPQFPYYNYVGDLADYPDRMVVGIRIFEKPMSNAAAIPGQERYLPNSTAAIFSLIYAMESGERVAQKSAVWLNSGSRTKDDIIHSWLNEPGSPDNIEVSAYAMDNMMKVYEAIKGDLGNLNIADSNYTKDLYPAWKTRVAELPENSQERKDAAAKLAQERFFNDIK